MTEDLLSALAQHADLIATTGAAFVGALVNQRGLARTVKRLVRRVRTLENRVAVLEDGPATSPAGTRRQ